MPPGIHPSAVVHAGARIGKDVRIDPFAVVDDDCEIGDGCTIGAHALIASGARLGQEVRVFAGACIGTVPQDLKFGGEQSTISIGDRTVIREYCTLNRGTRARGHTVIGSDCLLMAYCHVAHDCILGNNVVIANNLAMAGHVEIGNNVNIGGVVAVHQFCRIGDHAFVGAKSYVTQDVVPFALTGSFPTRIMGINKIGLERRGFDSDRRAILNRAYRTLFREGLRLDEALARLEAEYGESEDVRQLVDFARQSERGLLRM